MRRGERSTATATYFLVRQRELRKGAIKNYRAMLPRPPPPRLPTARRRPVPANLRAAAAKLPPTLPSLTHPMAGLRIQLAPPPKQPPASKPAKQHARDDSHQTQLATHVQGRGVHAPAPLVHESGALTDRVDRNGAARRAREMALPAEVTPRRGHGGAMPLMAPGKAGGCARVSEIRPLHSDARAAQQKPVPAASLGGISGRRAARFPLSSPRGKV